MSKPKPLSDAKGEVRELTANDLKGFRSAQKTLPASLRRKVGVQRTAKVCDQRAHHHSVVASRGSKLSRHWRGLADPGGRGAAGLAKEAQSCGVTIYGKRDHEAEPPVAGDAQEAARA